MGGGGTKDFRTSGAQRSQGDSGSDQPKDWPPHADRPGVLTRRASAVLAFITAQNAHRCFPRRRDVARFLDLPHKRQAHRVVEELIRTRYIACTERGLEIP